MKTLGLATIVALAAILGWTGLGAEAALADELTLANGDVLRGHVRDSGDFIVIEHSVLGVLHIPRDDVATFKIDGAPTADGSTAAGTVVAGKSAAGSSGAAVIDPDCTCDVALDSVEPGPCPWNFAIGAGLFNDSGNTEKTGVNGSIDASYRWSRNILSWRGTAFYEEADGIQTEGKYHSLFTYRREITERGRAFGAWLIDRDDFADILLRSGVFAGYEYDFVRKRRTRFAGGVGAGWIHENRSGQSELDTFAALCYLDFEHKFSNGDKIELYGRAIPYFEDFDRTPYRFEARYAHPIRDGLDITAGFLLDYVEEPGGDLKSYDTKLTFGLRWRPLNK